MGKGNAIFYGTVSLTGANLLLRLAAMGFQVYLSRRIGAAGIGLLQLILSVEALAFTAGSAGVRTCAVYLTAEELGRRHPQGVGQVLSGCTQYSLLWSILAALCLWKFAPWLSETWLGDPAAVAPLRIFSLFLPAKCLCGVMTGCLNAMGRVGALIAVEFMEQITSVALTFLLLSQRAEAEPGQACLAVTLGDGVAALLALGTLWLLCKNSVMRRRDGDVSGVFRRVLHMAIPLGLTDNLRAGVNAAENLIIPGRLACFSGTVNALADYGIVRGMVFPVLMFPSAILAALAELLVPELSRCTAGRRQVRVRYLAQQGLRATLLFGLCSGGLLFSLAEPLGELLYQNSHVGEYLRMYALLVPMLYTDIVVDAVCKGLGYQSANARYNLLTSVLDVALLWVLLPCLGLGGYYLSFVISHMVNFCLSFRRLAMVSGIRLEAGRTLRAILCAAASLLLTDILPRGAGLVGVVLSGTCYLLVLAMIWMVFRVISIRDVLWLRGLAARK